MATPRNPRGVIQVNAGSPSARALAVHFGAAAGDVGVSTNHIVRSFKQRALMILINKASGRPGPRVISGDYVGGLDVDTVGSNQFNARLRMTSDQPQANRLELGFTGVDSIGRYYDQPPFPHFGPALDQIEPELTAALVLNVERVLRE